MVTDHLKRHSIRSIAVDLPGRGDARGADGGLAECAAHLRERITVSAGPVIVCGHSQGGVIITEAVDSDSQVSHLVYIAALVPDVGESAIDCALVRSM